MRKIQFIIFCCLISFTSMAQIEIGEKPTSSKVKEQKTKDKDEKELENTICYFA